MTMDSAEVADLWDHHHDLIVEVPYCASTTSWA